MPEGFKEFNEVIWSTCSPRNWQRNRGLRLPGTKNEISHKNRARSKELEINGFLHNSRGTNKIDSTSSNTQHEQIPVIDFARPELLDEKSTEDLTTLYQNLNTRRSASDRKYELLVKIHSILTERTKKR